MGTFYVALNLVNLNTKHIYIILYGANSISTQEILS
jgi:hypothetical protein